MNKIKFQSHDGTNNYLEELEEGWKLDGINLKDVDSI